MSAWSEKIIPSFNFLNNIKENLYESLQTDSFNAFNIIRDNATVIGIGVYLFWYIKAYLSRTELVVQEGSIMHKITEKISCIYSGYRPTIWCYWASMNTIAFEFLQRLIKHEYYREIIKTHDGGQLAIDWVNYEKSDKKMVVLVFLGVGASSKSSSVGSHIVQKAKNAGCKAVVMNYRGIECELLTKQTYCASRYEDENSVVQHVHNTFKDHKLFAVGISLGGIKLGGYMAKHYDDCRISNALIVSAPLNYKETVNNLTEKPYYKNTFNKFLVFRFQQFFNKHVHWYKNDEIYDYEAIKNARTMKDIDIEFVCKQFGYENVNDYYEESSLDAKIENIKTPTLFLNSGDDMFSPESTLPIEQIKANPYTALIHTKYGGHIAFCEGLIPSGCNYACRILAEYLNVVLNETKNTNADAINNDDTKKNYY